MRTRRRPQAITFARPSAQVPVSESSTCVFVATTSSRRRASADPIPHHLYLGGCRLRGAVVCLRVPTPHCPKTPLWQNRTLPSESRTALFGASPSFNKRSSDVRRHGVGKVEIIAFWNFFHRPLDMMLAPSAAVRQGRTTSWFLGPMPWLEPLFTLFGKCSGLIY